MGVRVEGSGFKDQGFRVLGGCSKRPCKDGTIGSTRPIY